MGTPPGGPLPPPRGGPLSGGPSPPTLWLSPGSSSGGFPPRKGFGFFPLSPCAGVDGSPFSASSRELSGM